jgi:3-phenylpropionate/trans-cinnamate dioxygenase ferredoxin reductase subunit
MSHIAVVGASLAGVRVVENLRKLGFDGRLTLVGDEPYLPYDRPPLSKNALTAEPAETKVEFFDRMWFDDNAVELQLGRPATGVDVMRRELRLGASRVSFDDLVIATGARARNPFAPVSSGVWTLRTVDDAIGLRSALRDARKAVVIGAGFIGLEVASAARTLGAEVTIIEAAQVPLSRNLGPEVAPTIVELARQHGVSLISGRTVVEFTGQPNIAGVVLDDGAVQECDVVVVGVGASPNTDWIDDPALRATPAGLVCDRTGRAAPHVWAVGDVAAWAGPDGVPHRHEHWTSAGEQAAVVARNILDGGSRTVKSAPFVWSDQFGRRISIIGDTTRYDDVRFLSRSTAELAALYARDGRFVGACVVDQPRLVVRCRTLAASTPSVSEISEWIGAAA